MESPVCLGFAETNKKYESMQSVAHYNALQYGAARHTADTAQGGPEECGEELTWPPDSPNPFMDLIPLPPRICDLAASCQSTDTPGGVCGSRSFG